MSKGCFISYIVLQANCKTIYDMSITAKVLTFCLEFSVLVLFFVKFRVHKVIVWPIEMIFCHF